MREAIRGYHHDVIFIHSAPVLIERAKLARNLLDELSLEA